MSDVLRHTFKRTIIDDYYGRDPQLTPEVDRSPTRVTASIEETVIPAENNRYELIVLEYSVENKAGGAVVRVTPSWDSPVIAWRIYRSTVVEAAIAMPIGIGVTMDPDDDWPSSKRDSDETIRQVPIWYDKRQKRYYTLNCSGSGQKGWEAVCKSCDFQARH